MNRSHLESSVKLAVISEFLGGFEVAVELFCAFLTIKFICLSSNFINITNLLRQNG